MVPVVNVLDSICLVSMHLLYNNFFLITARTKLPNYIYFFVSVLQQVVSMLVSMQQMVFKATN